MLVRRRPIITGLLSTLNGSAMIQALIGQKPLEFSKLNGKLVMVRMLVCPASAIQYMTEIIPKKLKKLRKVNSLNNFHKNNVFLSGISKKTPICHEAFLECLYEDKVMRSVQPRIQFDKKSNTMKTVNQFKISLNSNITKRFVCEDRVTTLPLQQNNKFI